MNVKGKILRRGMWQIAYKATGILCSDGVYRTARTAPDADTFFSISASVKVKGKTVSGFITEGGINEAEGTLRFIAYSYGKNGGLLPDEFEADRIANALGKAERGLWINYQWPLIRERIKVLPGSKVNYDLMERLGITDPDRPLIRHVETWGWCGI